MKQLYYLKYSLKVNFNHRRARNVQTPQFSHFSTRAKVPCWNKCEIVPVSAPDLYSISYDGKLKFVFNSCGDGWVKYRRALFEVLYVDICISVFIVTHMAELSEEFLRQTLDLQYVSDLSRRLVCNKRHMLFAYCWHESFLWASH